MESLSLFIYDLNPTVGDEVNIIEGRELYPPKNFIQFSNGSAPMKSLSLFFYNYNAKVGGGGEYYRGEGVVSPKELHPTITKPNIVLLGTKW